MNKLAVLVSGSGTNLQTIIDATESGRLPETKVAVVVSNRRRAFALQRAERHGIATVYHPYLPYRRAAKTRQDYDRDLVAKLAPYQVDLVVLAGWMRMFSMTFLSHYPGRILNIHPALPGMFPGMHGIEQAYEAFQRGEIGETGVMVHLVPDEGMDEGPPVLVRQVPIAKEDTLESLEARIHETEHALYVEAIAQVLGIELVG